MLQIRIHPYVRAADNLTTVAQDTAAMARLAVTRAVARVEKTPIARRDLVVPPHLVVRGTTGALHTKSHDFARSR